MGISNRIITTLLELQGETSAFLLQMLWENHEKCIFGVDKAFGSIPIRFSGHLGGVLFFGSVDVWVMGQDHVCHGVAWILFECTVFNISFSLCPPGINAQARKLQRNRTKGTMTLLTGCKGHSTPPTLRRTVSETSLSQVGTQDKGEEEHLKRHYSTLPETLRCLGSTRDGQPIPAGEQNGNIVRYSLYESPHLLLLQGYSQQHVSMGVCLPLGLS